MRDHPKDPNTPALLCTISSRIGQEIHPSKEDVEGIGDTILMALRKPFIVAKTAGDLLAIRVALQLSAITAVLVLPCLQVSC